MKKKRNTDLVLYIADMMFLDTYFSEPVQIMKILNYVLSTL